MEVIYRMGEATAADIHISIPDPPSYSAVRALLSVLEEKKLVKHDKRGRAYLYRPTVSQNQVRNSALRHMMQTFFDGSVSSVVAALVNLGDRKLSDEELDRLERIVKDRRSRKRRKK